MIGETQFSYPTVQIPPVNFAGAHSPSDFSPSAFAAALQRYLPSNSEPDPDGSDSLSCDEFRMYEFKVRRCGRGRSHDWTECPFAHPGEKARRRDPRRYCYSGSACADFRKGLCKNGDSCEFAHGVFECWLHPTRYRTQPCKDGAHCTRRVCFFAHSPAQLRVLEPAAESPPMSPPGLDSVSELVGGMRGLQIETVNNLTRFRFSAGSPRTGTAYGADRFFDTWNLAMEDEPAMERVESGKKLRAAMYARLRRENFLDRAEPAGPGPDLGWVSGLVQ